MTTEKTGTRLKQGAYSQDTCFQITQHEYMGAETGYVETLEIHDAPLGYPKFFTLIFDNMGGYQFCYSETLEAAKEASGYYNCNPARWAKISGVTKIIIPPSIYCTPWCYAEEKKLVCDDYALPPEIVRTDESYRAGSMWFVFRPNAPTIETCEGARHTEKRSHIYFSSGHIVTFEHKVNDGHRENLLIGLGSQLWQRPEMQGIANFWNKFLAKGMGTQKVTHVRQMVDDVRWEFHVNKYDENFNLNLSIKKIGEEDELIAAYSRFNVTPKQFNGTHIDDRKVLPKVLVSLFESNQKV